MTWRPILMTHFGAQLFSSNRWKTLQRETLGTSISLYFMLNPVQPLEYETGLLNPRLSGLITAAPPTELQGQTGAGRGKCRSQFHFLFSFLTTVIYLLFLEENLAWVVKIAVQEQCHVQVTFIHKYKWEKTKPDQTMEGIHILFCPILPNGTAQPVYALT